ncbi:hypothetical protein DQ04_02201030 [Trypanosoma grayi]|uniref:hypothetical protein n=1 Tax=Trypanosoma grayi TaxID=71804 RepID=UPI0004F48D3E|nr:hypothetical protein DQ04_02201030 [Trypanosoma grayi]KEG11863.1 hypothetical protein DQ04_02201030 [Trypanosoma grayi]
MRTVGSSRVGRSIFLLSSTAPLRGAVRHVSLSELAKAFTEIGEGGTASDGAEGSRRHTASSAKGAFSPQKYPSSTIMSGTNDTGLGSSGTANNTTSTSAAASTTNISAARSIDIDSSSIGNSVVTFSPAYSEFLRGMSGPQFTTLFEREYKRFHQGHMLQCLVEVWRRLREAPPVEVLITEDEAHGKGIGSRDYGTAADGVCGLQAFRSDALLECVLRALAKTNLDEVQQSSSVVVDLRAGSIVDGTDWVAELSYLLLQWLTTRASSLSATRSATFIHLIAQQKVLHSDAVLDTLRDNIEVYLADYPKQHTASSYSTSADIGGGSGAKVFDVSVMSVLLDAIARWQMGLVRLLNTDVAATRHSRAYSTALVAVGCNNHPILNATFYDVVVSSLMRGVRDGSLHLTRQGSPTTFFFLTLALAKIRWFRADCVEVLLPQLHEALRVFPAQFLGVVLLLGRREVHACNLQTTDLLLQTLLDAMQKRGRRDVAADGSRRHRICGAALVVSSAATAPDALTAATANAAQGDIADGDDEDDDLQLFSAPSTADLGHGDAATRSGSSAVGGILPQQPMEFATSFLDLRSMPLFLDSLHHILATAHACCEAQGNMAQRRAIDAKAEALYEALLNDAHGGLRSMNMLFECPGLVEKLLLSLLSMPHKAPHPLLVELTYAFTRQVGMRRITRHDGGEVTTAFPVWQRRVMEIVDLLIQRGLLTSDTYVMKDDVISAAPRVAAAVAVEKKRLLEHYRKRQQQQEVKTSGKKTVRTRAVFAGFARVVGHIREKQQQYLEARHCHTSQRAIFKVGRSELGEGEDKELVLPRVLR